MGTRGSRGAALQDRAVELNKMNPRVRRVVASADYQLHIEFTNGERRNYDCRHLLDFGVFKELRDKNYFQKATAWDGTVVWPNEQDICPDTLYLDSIKSAEQGTEVGRS